jgi:RHS repeat-associated protein
MKSIKNMKQINRIISGGLLLSLMLLSVQPAFTQSPATLPLPYAASTVNYVRIWDPMAPEQTPGNLLIRPLTDVQQTTSYADGFGRPIQSVVKQASPAGKDMVAVRCFDPATGNEIYSYLPFSSNAATTGDVTNDGNFKPDAFQQQSAFYNTYLSGQPNETNVGSAGTNWAYLQTNYEASPENRILNTFSPGVSWVGSQASSTKHNVQQEFLSNTATDNVQIWNIPGWSISNPELASSIIPTDGGAYQAGALNKILMTNEQGMQAVEYKDSYGQVVLKKVQIQSSATPLDSGTGSGHTGWLCTYYVYDDHGDLRFVISPNLVSQMSAANNWTVSQTQADQLCYRFEYDQYNRMIIEKFPGTPTGTSGEVWMVYDQRNRLVLRQDGVLRGNHQWVYYQYDNLDRPIATGLITDNTYYSQLSYHLSNAATSGNNSSGVSAWPVLSNYTTEVLSQMYYDSYASIPSTVPQSMNTTANGTGNTAFTTAYNTSPYYPQPLTQSPMLQGMVTATSAEVLGSSGGQYISTVKFYDEKARTIQTQTYNYTKGMDIGTTQFSWNGRPLTVVMSQSYTSTVNPQTHAVTSSMNYDAMGRLLNVTESVSSTVNGVAVTSPATVLSSDQYDELSRLQKKTIGPSLETLTYAYNIRGWLLGINQGYIGGSATNYFAEELAYDKTNSAAAGNSYLYPAYNGSVAGTAWKSQGDGINRKYDFTYDNARRLQAAAFLQNSTGSSWDNSFIDFSVSGMGYDANGNLTAMNQNGFVQGGKQPIDQLSYNYVSGQGNSNQLIYVNDVDNVSNSTLGDFHFPGAQKTSSSVDYTYDANGNTISDFNRSATSMSYYMYPNLPNTITTPKGTIQFIYDAFGNKLAKLVNENATINGTSTTISATTKYLNGFEYKTLAYGNSAFASLNYTDVLQLIGADGGRFRFIPALGSVPASFVHDYMIRDHLGNVRVGLTDEANQDIYPAATGETTSVTVGGVSSTAQAYESQYYTFNSTDFISTSSLPAWFASMSGSAYNNENNNGIPVNNDPYSQTTTTSAKVLQLCGNTLNNSSGDNYGCGITLKVMSGDVISIYGKSFWNNTGNLPAGSYPLTSVITSLLGVFGNSSAVTSALAHSALGGTTFNSSTTSTTSTLLSPMLPTSSVQAGTQAPYAGINYIIFDDQFRPQGTVVGFDPVSTTTDNIKSHSLSVPITKNGYIFIYVSNQSNLNVYFDNLQVVQNHGHILEETHYYPVGLAMAGISDRAWNKTPNYFHFQGKEMQDEEWHDASGLEEYDFGARYYDPQLGRWNTQDPAGQHQSPYQAMGNAWPTRVDPNGEWDGWDDVVVMAVGFVVGFTEEALTKGGSLGKDLEAGAIDAAIAEAGYLGLGGGTWSFSSFDGNAVTDLAIPYASSFAATNMSTYFENEDKFQSASPDKSLGLIAGLGATSAISAGFSSQNMQQTVDAVLPDGWTGGDAFKNYFSGALSQGIGGAISNAGNNVLFNNSGWDASTLGAAGIGFAASFGGQVAHNGVGGLFADGAYGDPQDVTGGHLYYPWSTTDIWKNVTSNIASGITQQLITNIGNQIGSKNGGNYGGNPNWWQYLWANNFSCWQIADIGAYMNGLGGFYGDMANDAAKCLIY